MQASTVAKLIDLNHQFYQTFAVQFSTTRMRLQPGVKRVLQTISPEADILDMGCGNGELAQSLMRQSYHGNYVGLDFSLELLEIARMRVNREKDRSPGSITFIHQELTSYGWGKALPQRSFDVILAFAVLHHIPGFDLRRQILAEGRETLRKSELPVSGCFIHSEWQFLNSPRLRARIQPWEMVGLAETDVEAGDYLLDWRQGGSGLRYVHHFSPEELTALATETGFRIKETFFSDGEGSRLGIYQVWEGV